MRQEAHGARRVALCHAGRVDEARARRREQRDALGARIGVRSRTVRAVQRALPVALSGFVIGAFCALAPECACSLSSCSSSVAPAP
jgi:hypothetical protein